MPYDRSLFITRTPIERVAFDFMCDDKAFLHDKLFPPKVVSKSLTKYYQFDTSKLRVPNTRARTNALTPKIDEQLFTRDLTLTQHKLGADIDPADVRDADMPGLIDESRKAKIVTLGLLLQREQLAATLATTVANYPTSLTSALSAGDRWTDAGGDPEADSITAHEALLASCGMKANAVAMSGTTWRKLKTNPEFKDRLKFTNGGPVSMEAVKAFFEVDYFFVTDNQYDSAQEGATRSISSMWGSNVLFYVYNPSPDMESVSYGHTYLMQAPFWSATVVDDKRQGPAGPMRELTIGSEYLIDKGMVVSSSDSDFAAGYLFRTTVD